MNSTTNIYEVTEPLCRGAARIAFQKMDGRSVERYATCEIGTMLRNGATKEDCLMLVKHNADASKATILFWDIQEGGIRSFRKDRFEDIFP
jgi:hypothetical protein